jgi:hypothetical protein
LPKITAPVGQADAHPGSFPSARRSLQSSHLTIFGAASLHWNFGMPKAQATWQ